MLYALQLCGLPLRHFLVLTAARSGEIRSARWSEINLDKATWIGPAERMKAGKTHAVPLSEAALSVFKRTAEFRTGGSDLVFPGAKRGRPLSDMTHPAKRSAPYFRLVTRMQRGWFKKIGAAWKRGVYKSRPIGGSHKAAFNETSASLYQQALTGALHYLLKGADAKARATSAFHPLLTFG